VFFVPFYGNFIPPVPVVEKAFVDKQAVTYLHRRTYNRIFAANACKTVVLRTFLADSRVLNLPKTTLFVVMSPLWGLLVETLMQYFSAGCTHRYFMPPRWG